VCDAPKPIEQYGRAHKKYYFSAWLLYWSNACIRKLIALCAAFVRNSIFYYHQRAQTQRAGSEANANTIPAVGLPFAMTQWTAQTGRQKQSVPPYFYKDSMLLGFRVHIGSAVLYADYAALPSCLFGQTKTGIMNNAVSFFLTIMKQLHLPVIDLSACPASLQQK